MHVESKNSLDNPWVTPNQFLHEYSTYQFQRSGKNPLVQVTTSKFVVTLEEEVIRDVLCMLAGVQTSIFSFSNSHTFEINKCYLNHLSPESLEHQLRFFGSFGALVRRLQTFVTRKQEDTHPLTVQALAASLHKYLEQFKRLLNSVDTNTTSLLSLETMLMPYHQQFDLVMQIVEEIEAVESIPNAQMSAHVLSTLYTLLTEKSSLDSDFVILATLFIDTFKPYVEMLELWMNQGKIADPFNEFLILKDDKYSEQRESTEFWTSGYVTRDSKCVPNFLLSCVNRLLLTGKSVNMIANIHKEKSFLYSSDFKENILFKQFEQQLTEHFVSIQSSFESFNLEKFLTTRTPLNTSVDAPEENSSNTTETQPGETQEIQDSESDEELESEASQTEESQFSEEELDSEAFQTEESQLSEEEFELSEDVLSVLGTKHETIGVISRQVQQKLAFELPSPAPHLEWTYSEVEFSKGYQYIPTPIHVLLEKSLMSSFEELHRKKTRELILILLKECKLKEHLFAMRSYFFMEAGNLFHEFLTQIFAQIDEREAWYERNNLEFILQEQLSYAPPDLFGIESLSVSADVPEKFKKDASIQVLEYLRFSYIVPWPINIIIGEAEIQEYNKIQTFLIQIKRAKSSLDCITTSRATPLDHPDHSCMMLRGKLLHFVNNLQTYIITRVVQSLWVEFSKRIESAQNLDEVISLHRNYISTIRDYCLLNQKATLIMNNIKKILNLSLKFKTFYEALQLSAVGGYKEALAEHKKLDSEFEQCYTLLLNILKTILQQKKLPHLEDLVLKLTGFTQTSIT